MEKRNTAASCICSGQHHNSRDYTRGHGRAHGVAAACRKRAHAGERSRTFAAFAYVARNAFYLDASLFRAMTFCSNRSSRFLCQAISCRSVAISSGKRDSRRPGNGMIFLLGTAGGTLTMSFSLASSADLLVKNSL